MRLFQIAKMKERKNGDIFERGRSCVNVFICINFILYSSIYYRSTRKTEPHDSRFSTRPKERKKTHAKRRRKKMPQTLSVNINITNDTRAHKNDRIVKNYTFSAPLFSPKFSNKIHFARQRIF